MNVDTLFDDIRDRCRWVAADARFVRIDADAVAGFSQTLLPRLRDRQDDDPWSVGLTGDGDAEQCVALVLTLHCINFGSGYHPHVRKRSGCSGSTTMALGIRDWVKHGGPITTTRLRSLRSDEVFEIFDQPRTSEPVSELMSYYHRALTQLGEHVNEHYAGSFLALVEDADHSAARLVSLLDQLDLYHDVSRYRGVEVPFFKRAQVTAADLHRSFAGAGPGHFVDIRDLTAFADNLVPHVLRLDGVLDLDPVLADMIEREELLVHGDEPEVELRACAVQSIELVRAALRALGRDYSSAEIDQVVWTRGAEPRYKARPRPRARSTAY